MCPQYPCGCREYRDAAEVQSAQDRHPAGKAIPVEDINDYLRQKGEIQ
jgi:hypothetical protein